MANILVRKDKSIYLQQKTLTGIIEQPNFG